MLKHRRIPRFLTCLLLFPGILTNFLIFFPHTRGIKTLNFKNQFTCEFTMETLLFESYHVESIICGFWVPQKIFISVTERLVGCLLFHIIIGNWKQTKQDEFFRSLHQRPRLCRWICQLKLKVNSKRVPWILQKSLNLSKSYGILRLFGASWIIAARRGSYRWALCRFYRYASIPDIF